MARSLVLAVVSSLVLLHSAAVARAGISVTASTRWTDVGLDPNFVETMTGVGDLNGDGYGDVAWGLGGTVGSGQVYVLYGSPSGLHPVSPPHWDWAWEENTPYGSTRSEVGASISAGDVNGDGYDDLVVGAPAFLNDLGTAPGPGAVMIWLGRHDFGSFGRPPDVVIDASQGLVVSSAPARFGAVVDASTDVDG